MAGCRKTHLKTGDPRKRKHTSRGRELHQEVDVREQVDVGIVDGELKYDRPGVVVYPAGVQQLIRELEGCVREHPQVCHVASPSVRRQFAPVRQPLCEEEQNGMQKVAR